MVKIGNISTSCQTGTDSGGEDLNHNHQDDHTAKISANHTPTAGIHTLDQRGADTARTDDTEGRGILDIDVKAIDDC